MDATQIPYFVFSSNGAYVTRRLLEFRKSCSLFINESMAGRDPSVKIMTKIIDYSPLRGVRVLNNLFELLKDSVFSYQVAMVKGIDCPEQKPHLKLQSSCDIAQHNGHGTRKGYETFLPWKTYRACKTLYEDLLRACRDHESAVRHLREAVKSFREINEKCTKACDKLQKSAEEFYACTLTGEQINFEAASLSVHQKCVQLSDRYNVYKEKAKQAYDRLVPLFEKERNIREERINKTEDTLRSLIVTEIRETLIEGMKNLLKVATATKFPKEFVDYLESFDCHEAAAELYNDLTGKYLHPVIDESYPDTPVAMTSYMHQQFAVMEKVEQGLRAHGSHVCLLEEKIYDKRREELYVWANESLQEKNKTAQLRLKPGTLIKQKLCSADGKLAFGWKRTFAGGTKKYGFFPTAVTRLVP